MKDSFAFGVADTFYQEPESQPGRASLMPMPQSQHSKSRRARRQAQNTSFASENTVPPNRPLVSFSNALIMHIVPYSCSF